MATLATLGDLSIEILVNDFQSFELQSEYGYAIHKKLDGKPSLQMVGDGLRSIRFDFIFHKQLIDPELGVLQLRTLAERKSPLSLVFGEVYKGQWVIERIEEKPMKVSVQRNQAVITVLGCAVELVEFTGGRLRTPEQSVALNPFSFLS
jgi:phage protein U